MPRSVLIVIRNKFGFAMYLHKSVVESEEINLKKTGILWF